MTTPVTKLTATDFDHMETEDNWRGFGYLGERRNMTPEDREACDSAALAAANEIGMTYTELFEWANSKDGRWYADCRGDRHSVNYLPQ